jgi:decaprenyl-phosphate phosphoribosyltransferase
MAPGIAAHPGRDPVRRAATWRRTATGLIVGARPAHWLKNIVIPVSPLAAGKEFDSATIQAEAVVLIIFCAAASAFYLINDARDANADRQHPRKRRRPVAAGVLPARAAYGVGVVLALGSCAAAATLCKTVTALTIIGYVVLQALYNAGLKHLPIIETIIVTAGFPLRAAAGCGAAGVRPSAWFLAAVTVCSLCLVLGKRCWELGTLGRRAYDSRALLARYSPTGLRRAWAGSCLVTGALYAGWMLAMPGPALALLGRLGSAALLTSCLRRYYVDVGTASGPEPELVLLTDRVLLVLGAGWLLLFIPAALIYPASRPG